MSVLLLTQAPYRLLQRASAGLIAVAYDDPTGPRSGETARAGRAVNSWADVADPLQDGRVTGSGGGLNILRAAVSIAEGSTVDLGGLASNVDRWHLRLLLAAIAHAGGGPARRSRSNMGTTDHGGTEPLIAWPPRD